jgi:O-antigen/teichoic acid export membrane protein
MNVISQLRLRMKRLKKSSFLRNVTAVATGIAAAQAISLAFTPLLTRLYGPEAFGSLAAFTAVVNIIMPLSTLGFANAIVMPATQEGATAVARLSMVCAALVAPISLVLVWLFQTHLARWTGLGSTPGFLYLVPVSLFLGALLSVANQVALREGLFKSKAGAHVASTLLMNVGKLAGGIVAPSGLILIVIAMVGKALNYSMLLARVPRKGAFQVGRWFGIAGIREAAKEQRDFALYRMPQSVINAAAVGLPVFLLSASSGAQSAGQYSITVLVLGAPVMLISQSVGEVFYPKIAEAIRNQSNDARRWLVKATLVIGLLAALICSIFVIFGPQLFAFALGEDWRLAGEYSRWVAPWFACVLATRPVVASFASLKLNSYLFAHEVMSIFIRSSALVLGLKYWESDLVAVALFSLAGVILMVILAIVGFYKLRYDMGKWGSRVNRAANV